MYITIILTKIGPPNKNRDIAMDISEPKTLCRKSFLETVKVRLAQQKAMNYLCFLSDDALNVMLHLYSRFCS